jgi:4-hydroxythreonine-4-phosphate dehydrogenase
VIRATRTVRLAVTLGDPRGIGPEVAAAAARTVAAEQPESIELVFVGPPSLAPPSAHDVVSVPTDRPWDDPAQAGRIAAAAIREAVRLALAGEVSGIVTAPIDKAALHAAGEPFPGHTEMLAELARVRDVVMLMAAERTRLGGPLRVVLATKHVPLARVPDLLSPELLVSQARIVERALREDWQIARPRLALCAVNPHASDGGLFGDEEARIVKPALDTLTAAGLDATGPLPADTVFVRALRGDFDVVIAPYHDVGMAAFKTASFGQGVNVTLGLPFVRTSPDHGTALDIAGKGVADPSSMAEAIRLAARLARARQVLSGMSA